MKKVFCLAVLAAVFASGFAAAADPDVTWRESVRVFMASNGVTRAGVTNVLSGNVLPACNGNAVTNLGSAAVLTAITGGLLPACGGSAVTNISGANISAGNISLYRLTNAFNATLVSQTITGVVSRSGAATSNWVFVNGVLTGN